MNERLKELRKRLGLSREEFAKKLGLKSRGKIENIELNRTTPDNEFLELICSTYNVNYHWLVDGCGEMFVKKTKDEELSEMLADIQKAGEDSFRHRLVSALARLDDEGWDNLEKLIDMISNK